MCGDLLASLERASSPSLFDLDEDSEGGSEDFGNDAVERDERRLAELGRRTIEMYALHHLFTTKVEVSFAEAQAIKMQEALIAEEEEAERVAAEIEGAKKSKKAKQKQRKKDKKEAEEAELAAKMAEEEAEIAAELDDASVPPDGIGRQLTVTWASRRPTGKPVALTRTPQA